MLLTLAIFIPLAGAILLLLIPERQKSLIRGTALLTSIVAFVPIVALGIGYAKKDADKGWLSGDVELVRIADERLATITDAALRQEVSALAKDPAMSPRKLGDAKVAELKAKNVYETFHEAWELNVAAKTALTKHIGYVEYGSWIRTSHIHYFLGVDGLSLPLIEANS